MLVFVNSGRTGISSRSSPFAKSGSFLSAGGFRRFLSLRVSIFVFICFVRCVGNFFSGKVSIFVSPPMRPIKKGESAMCIRKTGHVLPMILFLLSIPVFGQDEAGDKKPPPSTTSVVLAPYDKVGGPRLDPKQSVLLPYAEFLRLKKAAKDPDAADYRPGASIVQSSFKGVAEGDVALFDSEFVIEVLARPKDRLTVNLPFSGASIESASVEGPRATLGSLEKEWGLSLTVLGEGRRTVRLKLAAPLVSEGALKRLDFVVPKAAASSLSLRVDEEVTVKYVKGSLRAAVVSVLSDGKSEIKAACGSRDRLFLEYRSKLAATGEAAQARMAVETEIRLTVSSRGADARVGAKIDVLAGSLRSVQIELPRSAQLLNVSGPFVKDWSLIEENRLCLVALVRPVSEAFEVVLDVRIDSPVSMVSIVGENRTEPDESRRALLSVPEFKVPKAVRESGRIIVIPDSGLSVWPEETSGLEAVPAQVQGTASARAYRFAQPGWRLTLSSQPIPARIRSDGLLLYEATEETIRLKSHHRLTIAGRGIFGIVFEAPEGFELREAGPPSLVSGFRQNGRRVAVNFLGEQIKTCELTLSMQKPRSGEDNRIELAPIAVEGAEEDRGNVVLAMPLALRATELESSGLEATDVRALRQRLGSLLSSNLTPALGYRYFTPDFRALASIERQRTRLTCETARLANITPSLMRVDTTLNYNVEFSATDTFQLLVPATAGEDVRFSGSDIKEKKRSAPAGGGDAGELTTWTIRLQRRVIGPYRLEVSFDVPLAPTESGETLNVSVPVVRAAGVARETGFLAVSRGENLEVSVGAAPAGLERRDVKELPRSLANAFLGFRYFDPDNQSLDLEIVRHETEGVLGALIRRVHIDTVLSDQREALHEVYFEVQNNNEPYLELKLPEGLKIWSAFVRGAPVRPTIRKADGARLIELAKSESGDKAFRVRLILRETLPGGEMGISGKLAFFPPEPINMPVLRTTWKLHLPASHRYVGFGGSMQMETNKYRPWVEPAAEMLLNDFPATVAGGIARPAIRPRQVGVAVRYDSTETEVEKRARLRGTALDIDIVKEGMVIEFSKLSGLGTIEVRYWKQKPLVLLQGALAILVFLFSAIAMLKKRRVSVGLAIAILAFVAASLTDGMTGRLCATTLAAAGAALALGLLVVGLARSRSYLTAQKAKAVAASDAPPPGPSPPDSPSSEPLAPEPPSPEPPPSSGEEDENAEIKEKEPDGKDEEPDKKDEKPDDKDEDEESTEKP